MQLPRYLRIVSISDTTSIRGPQRRARRLPAQHSKLMAKDDDLKLFEIRRAKAQEHERHQTPHHHVQQRRQHQPSSDRRSQRDYGLEQPKTPAPTGTIGFMHPTGRADATRAKPVGPV